MGGNDRYAGRAGATRTEHVHFSCPCGTVVAVEVYRVVNATDDPDVARRLRAADPEVALNIVRCPTENRTRSVDVSVVYHDPSVELFVLVLPESLRHRELIERAELLLRIADDTSCRVPEYVKDAPVVYEPSGLERLLESRAEVALDEARLGREADDVSRVTAQLDSALADLARRTQAVDDREAALNRRSSELEHRTQELDELGAELTVEQSRLRAAIKTARRVPPQDEYEVVTDPFEQPIDDVGDDDETEQINPEEVIAAAAAAAGRDTGELIEIDPEPIAEGEVVVADQIVDDQRPPPRSARVADDGSTHVGGTHDVAVERWIVSREESMVILDEHGKVRLAVSLPGPHLEDLLSDNLQLRLQLHRMPSYPLVTLSIGTTQAYAGELPRIEPFCFHLDIGADDQRAAVAALAEDFTFVLDLYDTDYLPVRRRTVTAGFAENARVLVPAADEYLTGLAEHERSFNKAVVAHSSPDYDRYARSHPERREFRDDKLQSLDSANDVRRAIAIARRFSKPKNEDYLLLLRGYPLTLWRQRRRAVIHRAADLGLWLGPDLGHLAVSEGIVPSRRELATLQQRNFAHLVADESQHNLDADAVRDNWTALGTEMTSLGLSVDEGVRPRTDPIDSEESEVASGTIGRVTALVPEQDLQAAPAAAEGLPIEQQPTDALLAHLENKDSRLRAALELCNRKLPRAMKPVFEALERMTRGEAGRVLGRIVSFGPTSVPLLLEALESRKGFLRQGAALGLAVLRDEEGVEAICDLLVSEPTEIWREIARSIGEVGPGAVMSLASRLANQPQERRERVAWALAHIAARGASQPIETVSRGRDPVAAGVARHALELVELARTDDIAVRGRRAPRDQTVNRAFSRRFFESLERDARSPTPLEAMPVEADRSGPAMLLDEADLMEATDLDAVDDVAEPLDESDLLPG